MKFKSLILGAALLVSGVGAANASSTWVGLNGGAAMPTGDYSDAAATGFQFGVTGTRMLNGLWGVGGDVNYHMWNGSDDANAAAEVAFGPGSEFKWTALQTTAHLLMSIPTHAPVTPYVKAGVGLYNLGIELKTPAGSSDASESRFGYNIGAGMNLSTGMGMKWGLNAAYHIIPNEETFGPDVNAFSFGLNLLWGIGL